MITIIAVTFSISYIFNQFLLTRDIYYNTFQSQLESARIDELFDLQLKYLWIGYLVIPVWITLKNLIITLCLQIGLLLNNSKLKFSHTFRIALTAEFVFLLPQLIKLIWFLLVKTNYTLTDVQQFYPLSALNLFNIENLSALSIYPFQTFNLFEIMYWIILAGGIKQALNTDINKGIKVVFSGYIPALALWLLCVMFITVSLSPAT
ncbi:hypothetical protein H7U22_15215 [Pedobacter sp. CCM 8938]|uniref:Yip1 domain-containing protein n=1 Tax=Pedobacter fastidiosus TaxID=2765361 RepID=A0ABR7KVJ0_9SPHI|nr:hypothetical protein [Pedobacter fastidiosus]MBC6111772.1 hypothetical protein [Pedobacter fastidiosus]